jgi:hypothetical protein
MRRQVDQEKSKVLMKEYDSMITGREKAYRDKMNAMNDKIYHHGMKHADYMNEANSKVRNDPFHLMNDFDFNKRLAEMKANEREAKRNDPNNMVERVKMVKLN